MPVQPVPHQEGYPVATRTEDRRALRCGNCGKVMMAGLDPQRPISGDAPRAPCGQCHRWNRIA